MSLSKDLLHILACPITGNTLTLTDHKLSTVDGKQQYPIINDIPWLLPNPENSLADWITKLQYFNQILESEIQELQQAIPHLVGQTQQRLQALLAGKQTFLADVNQLLAPIIQHQPGNRTAYEALSDKAPNTQNLLSYEANLYRDWAWGEEENQQTAKIVLDQITSKKVGKFLVLGAGAGRLALDIHHALKPDLTLASDINPLLVLAAQQLLRTGALDIVEFPLEPRKSEWVAIEHQLSADTKADNFHFIFSDANQPACQAGSFDLVLTPWLIDIQPLECSQFLQQLNQYLPIGGQWINFGSLVFYQNRDAFCYSIEEVEAIAKQQGFILENIQEHEIPYLNSPYNAGYRMERVWSWRGIKEKNVEPLTQVQTLPDWLLDKHKAIPKADYIQHSSLTHRVYAQLTAEVDGRMSMNKIAKKLAKQYHLDEKECLSLVRNFFIDLYRKNN